MLACFKYGLIWRGIKHDWSKFLPSEWIPYARFFYEPDGTKKTRRDSTGYYKPTDTGDKAFDFAWLLHQKRNRHHWQWWILPEDNGGIKVLEMHKDDALEMYCDWIGAGRAQGVVDWQNPKRWYDLNKHKMQLHPETQAYVESLMGVEYGSRNISTPR
jgi:hypothetical protein